LGNGIVHTGALFDDKLIRPGRILFPDIDADHFDPVVGLLLQLCQMGNGLDARNAPRGPGLNDVNYSFVEQGRRLSFDPSADFELGSPLADSNGKLVGHFRTREINLRNAEGSQSPDQVHE
jgi:hypothetical protein